MLMDLFAATNGTGWTNASQWGSALPVEYWHGVVVDGSGSVTGLYLNANRLSGTLPSALGDLGSLEVLSMTGNKLVGSIPSSVGRLTSLRQLWLDSNSLTGSLPTSLVDMAALQSLYVSSNHLTGTLPDAIGTMASLEVLYVDTNSLSGTIPSSLETLAQIRVNADGITGVRLQLHTNAFTGTLPSSFCSSPYRLLVFTFENDFSCYEPCDSLGNDLTYIDYVGGNEYGTCGGQYEALCQLNDALGINDFLASPSSIFEMLSNRNVLPAVSFEAGLPYGGGKHYVNSIISGVEPSIDRYETTFNQDVLNGYGLNQQVVVAYICNGTVSCFGPFMLGNTSSGFVSTLPGLTGNPPLVTTNPIIVLSITRVIGSGTFYPVSYAVRRFIKPRVWKCGKYANGKNPCLWEGSMID